MTEALKDDSPEDLLAKLRAQRELSKAGLAEMKKTRYNGQQAVQARTMRTQGVIEQLRAEEEAAEAAESLQAD